MSTLGQTDRARSSDIEPYAAKPEPLTCLAQSLGLESDASVEQVYAGIQGIVEEVRKGGFAPEVIEAADLLDRATCYPGGQIYFPELHQVSLVTWKGNVARVVEVKEAIHTIRAALADSSAERLPEGHRTVIDSSAGGLYPNQPSQQLPETLQERLAKNISGLEVCIRYLQDNLLIPPKAKQGQRPPPEMFQKLSKHGMSWQWNQDTDSWDPKLDTNQNQSLFRASLIYFKKCDISPDSPNPKEIFLRAARDIRRLHDREVREDRPYLERLSYDNQHVWRALVEHAQELVERRVDVIQLMRLKVLYELLQSS